ncbi:TetR/AcrR family transcriptional regulator [Cryptosporangium phraense]|uniref:TetR/AcrR family transcriptional regulator n=1 Tax=Cryptosporangium phraense TaxID=2593070 RepID=A0A545AQS4_9ACTN|nr:TetR/AcrR family transcriptional regulator [Cryptosporangium phraense]TQS43676.1 TetR/AcrR family transcriptional regulator [Cryptosporangium phraense]
MASRREAILDAAIDVLGHNGIHGLTHRTTDEAAGLPKGSTANLFSTRDALLDAVVERFAARERANWDDLATRTAPTDPKQLAHTLTLFAHDATGPNRTLTLARYAILVEAAIQPTLRAQLSQTGARVDGWFTHWVRLAGSSDPERHTPVLMNHWTGIVLHQLAVPDPAFDPSEQITTIVEALLP